MRAAMGKGEHMTNTSGDTLTCSNDECDCLLRVERPCPHGATYTCACGHPMHDAGGTTDFPPTPGA